MLAPFLTLLTMHSQTICIDPGHPSEIGRGTAGKKITEIHAVWLTALELKKLLTADGYTVVMTKSKEEQMVRNADRAGTANAAHADLMLRLHCDADSHTGFATFYPDKAAKDGKVFGPPPDVLKTSKAYAPVFHKAVMSVLKGSMNDRGVRTERQTAVGAQKGALIGSIHSKVPVLLVEMAVITQKHDDDFMASVAGRSKMAKALKAGIDAVFD